DFFHGSFDDRLGGKEWSIFLDADYIDQTIQVAIDQAISDVVPDEVQIFVGSHYSNADGRARIVVDVEGIVDVPVLGKLSADPHVSVELTVPLPNTIQIDVGIPDIHQLLESLIKSMVPPFILMTGPVGGLLGAAIDSLISSVKEPDLPAQ